MGGEVPKSYYLNRDKPKPSDSMKCEVIQAGSKKRIDIEIHDIRSLLRCLAYNLPAVLHGFVTLFLCCRNRWRFMTEDGDIAFQIVFIKTDGEELPLVPRDRIGSDEWTEEGEIVCIYRGNCNYFAVCSLNNRLVDSFILIFNRCC